MSRVSSLPKVSPIPFRPMNRNASEQIRDSTRFDRAYFFDIDRILGRFDQSPTIFGSMRL
jgi:hypothetical protein